MKTVLLCLIIGGCISFTACKNNNKDDHSGHHSSEQPQTEADSLEKEVIDGHDVAMVKVMGPLRNARKETKRLLDSIATLPAKAKTAAASAKEKLETLLNELDYAESAMDRWMGEINFDSAKNNIEQRIQYLTEEKFKVNKVKEAVENSLAKADSVLKAKL